MKYRGIRHNLVYSFSMYFSILLVAIHVATYFYFRYTTREQIFAQQFSTVSLVAKGIDDSIATAHNTLIAVAGKSPVDVWQNRYDYAEQERQSCLR